MTDCCYTADYQRYYTAIVNVNQKQVSIIVSNNNYDNYDSDDCNLYFQVCMISQGLIHRLVLPQPGIDTTAPENSSEYMIGPV